MVYILDYITLWNKQPEDNHDEDSSQSDWLIV